MAEELTIDTGLNREERYKSLVPQLKSLLQGESDFIANMANVAAALNATFAWHWIGFYRVINNELVLGPFQGPIACTRIAKGKGVCGTSWAEGKALLVPNVDDFPGHIACSALSKSELVIPVKHRDEVIAVLDIDSAQLNDFNLMDMECLQEIVSVLEATL